MSWWAILDDLAIAAVWLILPGLLIAAAAGLRWLPLLATAPVITVALVSIWAIIAPLAGIALTPVATAVVTVGAAALTFLARWWYLHSQQAADSDPAHNSDVSRPVARGLRDRTSARVLFSSAIAGIVITMPASLLAFKQGMVLPDRPPQTWDAVFHLNAITQITGTGDGSSLTLGTLNNPEATRAFYPAAWHDIAALITQSIPDASAVLTANAISILLVVFLWPIGLGHLSAQLWPNRPWVTFFTTLLAGTTIAFPLRLVSYGTLWPTALGYVMIPVLLGLIHRLTAATQWRQSVWAAAAAAPLILGMALAHPVALFSLGFLSLGLIGRWWLGHVRACKRGTLHHRLIAVVLPAVVVIAAAGYYFSGFYSGQSAFVRTPFGTVGTTLAGVFTDAQLSEQGYGNNTPLWFLLVATLTGVFALWRWQEHRWLTIGLLAASLLYLGSVLVEVPGYQLLAPWYFDPVRLGAMVLIAQIPIAAAGFAWVIDLVPQKWRSVMGIGLVLAVIGLSMGLRIGDRANQLDINYHVNDQHSSLNSLITDEEIKMMREFAAVAPADSLVIGTPFNGSSLLPAIAGVDTVFPHLTGRWPPNAMDLAQDFADGSFEVCRAVDELGITHLYLDQFLYWPDNPAQERYSGLDAAIIGEYLDAGQPGPLQLDEQFSVPGGASIHSISGC